jgi:hypothetical protein
MAIDCANARSTRAARIEGEWGVKGWSCQRAPSKACLLGQPERSVGRPWRRSAAHPPLVDPAAQRCLRTSKCWAGPVGPHLRCRSNLSASRHEGAVKTQRAHDTRLLRFCQPSVVWLTVDLPSGARSGRSSRPSALLEASLRLPTACHRAADAGTPKYFEFASLKRPVLHPLGLGSGEHDFELCSQTAPTWRCLRVRSVPLVAFAKRPP